MDLRKVKKLIELLEDSALTEMEITEGDSTIRLSRAAARQPTTTALQVAASSAAIEAAMLPDTATPATAAVPATATPTEAAPATAAGRVVHSPLVGTFYDSPSPDDKPFVSVGSRVGEGDTLCLIEAMKTFNQLEAEIGGVVSVIYKHNGDPVEYGEPLFVIDERADD